MTALHRKWTANEDRKLVSLQYQGARDKVIAREMRRSPSSINNRFGLLRRKLANRYSGILNRHRQEELELLQLLIAECGDSEVHGSER